MKSSIKIDFIDRGTGKGLEPVILVNIHPTSDPRDKLVQALFEQGANYLQINHQYRETGKPSVPGDHSVVLFIPEENVGPLQPVEFTPVRPVTHS